MSSQQSFGPPYLNSHYWFRISDFGNFAAVHFSKDSKERIKSYSCLPKAGFPLWWPLPILRCCYFATENFCDSPKIGSMGTQASLLCDRKFFVIQNQLLWYPTKITFWTNSRIKWKHFWDVLEREWRLSEWTLWSKHSCLPERVSSSGSRMMSLSVPLFFFAPLHLEELFSIHELWVVEENQTNKISTPSVPQINIDQQNIISLKQNVTPK